MTDQTTNQGSIHKAILKDGLKDELKAQFVLTQSEAEAVAEKMDPLISARLWAGLRFVAGNKQDPLTWIFFLESLVALKQKGKSHKLQKLFVGYADEAEKIELLDGFLFSRRYRFGTKGKRVVRHVMFRGFLSDEKWKSENFDPSWNSWRGYCSGGTPSPICFCVDWIKSQKHLINKYLRVLIGHLYEMRCAVVHEAFPVVFFPDLFLAPHIQSTMRDAYPIGHGLSWFRSYESSIRPNRFIEILRNVAKCYLLK